MKLVCTLIACEDCIAYVANGDIPEHNPTLPTEIQDNLQLTSDQRLVNADGCDKDGKEDSEDTGENWFSWCACECCGDWHGGMRNRLAILEPENETVG